MSHDGRRSKEGLEIHFSVNYLGHFLIVNSLLSILKKSQDPRVVVVSSILLKEGQIHTESLGKCLKIMKEHLANQFLIETNNSSDQFISCEFISRRANSNFYILPKPVSSKGQTS